MNPQLAQRRADDLQIRLETRMKDLDDEARMTQRPPVIVGSVFSRPRWSPQLTGRNLAAGERHRTCRATGDGRSDGC